MLRILGPTWKDTGETVTDEIIYIDDHHWDEQSQGFPVLDLLKRHTNKLMLVFDHLGHDDQLKEYPHCCLPVYLAYEVENFRNAAIKPAWTQRSDAFNFMINKPRPNRYRLLELLDKHNLKTNCYSLPWTTSPVPSIAPKSLIMGHEVCLDRGLRNGSVNNAQIYQNLLQRQVFESSCVSLITEPCFFEREAMITEKTIMAMMAGTVPLWIGGWALPDVMRQRGFDVFDDFVDHSYSQLSDPWLRCDQALNLNLEILRDVESCNAFLQNNLARFQHNLDLIMSNIFLQEVQIKVQSDSRLVPVAQAWNLPLLT